MFYRFEIDKKFFKNKMNSILYFLYKIIEDNHSLITFHLIIKDLKISDISDDLKRNIFFNRNVKFYSSYNFNRGEEYFPPYLEKRILFISNSKEIMTQIYNQEIRGFDTKNIKYNYILKVNEEGLIEERKLKIDKIDFFDFQYINIDSDFGLVGNGIQCITCLNPICEFNNRDKCLTNIKNIQIFKPDYLVDIFHESLIKNTNLLKQLNHKEINILKEIYKKEAI